MAKELETSKAIDDEVPPFDLVLGIVNSLINKRKRRKKILHKITKYSIIVGIIIPCCLILYELSIYYINKNTTDDAVASIVAGQLTSISTITAAVIGFFTAYITGIILCNNKECVIINKNVEEYIVIKKNLISYAQSNNMLAHKQFLNEFYSLLNNVFANK